jgi:hypothetical protein
VDQARRDQGSHARPARKNSVAKRAFTRFHQEITLEPKKAVEKGGKPSGLPRVTQAPSRKNPPMISKD